MNTISFRLKSEMKFQTVEIDSTFISAGELRQLICEKLKLDTTKEMVQLWDNSGANAGAVPYPDEKQVTRGAKLKVARTPLNKREPIGNAVDLASAPSAATEADTQPPAEEPEPDEFGGDLFKETEQLRRHIQVRFDLAVASCCRVGLCLAGPAWAQDGVHALSHQSMGIKDA